MPRKIKSEPEPEPEVTEEVETVETQEETREDKPITKPKFRYGKSENIY